MNKEEIIRLAREAASEDGTTRPDKNIVLYAAKTSKFLERFAALVAAEEREACAKVCAALWCKEPEPGDARDCYDAIREALADSALDRMAENARELGIQMQPEQKPIARLQWADGWTVTLLTGAEDIPSRSGPYALYVGPAPEQPAQQEPFGYFRYDLRLDAWVQNREGRPGTPFYTSPPASKPWVGLVWGELPEDGHNHDFLRGAVWAEAKLREKNA